jgi:hypothetical protein
LVEGIQETFDDDINEIKKIGEIIENIKNTLTEMEESANQRRKSREVDK